MFKLRCKMKRVIVYLILTLLLSFSVSAWGASRAISGNTVTITADLTDAIPINDPQLIILETIGPGVGLTVVSFPGCFLHPYYPDTYLCNVDTENRVFTYTTSGAGFVSGKIFGSESVGSSSISKTITGDTVISLPLNNYGWCGDGTIDD